MPPAKKKSAAKKAVKPKVLAKLTRKAAPKKAVVKKGSKTPKKSSPVEVTSKALAMGQRKHIAPQKTTSVPKAPTPPAAQKPQPEASKLKGIRIRLSAFDHTVIDEAALKITDTAMRSGAVVHGPTPLPTKIRKFTVNRSTFVHKDARDQFEMRTHRRLIDLTETTFKTVDALQNLSLPSGVDIEIRMG